MPFDREKIEAAVRALLAGLGHDPDSPNLVDTPGRVARMYEQVLRGTDQDPLEVIETGDWVRVDADNGIIEVTKK